jgi:hypothetical protein
MQVQPGGVVQYLVPAAVIVIVMAFRLRRMSQVRPLKLERLWIFPALYGAVCAYLLYESPPTLAGWGLCALALVAGVLLGWQRGKTMQIMVDPVTHQLNQKASIVGMVFIVVLIALRNVARIEGQAMHLSLAMVTDIFVVFALGLFAAQRLEMFLRANRLLETARRG